MPKDKRYLGKATDVQSNLLVQGEGNYIPHAQGFVPNNVTVRRIQKVTVHCFLSLIVVQAQALHSATSNQVSAVRQCVHA